MAFNAKDLHYEKQEPAFLRRLRGEHGGDRHNVQIARPKKERLKTADDDDGPTIVDESGNVIDQGQYEEMRGEKEHAAGGPSRTDGSAPDSPVVENEEVVTAAEAGQAEKQKVVEVGAPRKRKAIKVVGDDVEDIDVVKMKSEGFGDRKEAESKTSKAKPAKKAKMVKLSFDEPDS